LEIVSSTKEILQLNIGGGFIRSKTWMKILADITGKKLCVIETEDSSAIGAAILNLKSLKMIEDYSSLEPNDPILIEPDLKNHSLYKKYNSVFKNLYPSLKESMHQAYKISNR
jgi:gluconokinase